MDEKLTVLLTFLALSLLITMALLLLAKRGRNLRRFGDRQLFWHDLYRFIVLIVTASAMYLAGLTAIALQWLTWLPDAALVFATTAVPMFVLCLISGRWYLGYAATLCVQGFLLLHGQALHPGLWHGTIGQLLGENALCDLSGLLLYSIVALAQKNTKKQQEQNKHLARYLQWQRTETSSQ